MSEDRDQAGAPVEQVETTETQVLAAVERAAEVAPYPADAGTTESADLADLAESANASPEVDQGGKNTESWDRPVIAATTDPPNAGKLETAEEIFAAHPAQSAPTPPRGVGAEPIVAAHATVVSATELPVLSAGQPDVAPAGTLTLPPTRDGEIRISSDHPMAALYMQSPTAPEMKGNRGAGVLIALLSTVAFALVYAGVLALWLAPNYPPSTFLDNALLPAVMNWAFIAAVIGFFVGFALLVLIAGRAGWWAYVIGGLFVAAFTWAVTLLGFALDARLGGESVSLQPLSLLSEYGLFFPVIAAAIVAREVSVWFGAWIGSRGRKVKRQNAAAVAEYEIALAEMQAKQQ